MKICVVNPPSLNSPYINRDLMGGLGVAAVRKEKFSERMMSFLKARSIRLPVMSLVYSATLLAEKHEVLVIDAANLELTEEETLKRLAAFKPDWVLSATSISALMAEVALLQRAKKELGFVLGLTGDAATLMAPRVLEAYDVDFIIRGDEPELVVREILRRGCDYKGVKGVIWKEQGRVRDCGDPGYVPELDDLPFPDWSLFPIPAYRYFPILRKTPFVTVLSTRGCPYGCIYCPYTSNQGLKYRFRSAPNVVDELTHVMERYGVRAVQFRDPTFTLRKERVQEICDGMIKNRLDLEWGCETRVDCLNEALIDKMVEAGLKGVNIGIESSDPGVIRNAKRGWIDPKHIEKMVSYMHSRGVRVSGFFIVGLPGDTRATVRETLNFSLSIPLSYAEFKIATPFPGTPLFEMAKKNGWIEEVKLEDYTAYTPSMKMGGDLDGDSLKDMASEAYRKFYMRPGKVMREVLGDSFLPELMSILMTRREAA